VRAIGALVGGPLVGLGAGLLIVALLPWRVRRIDRELPVMAAVVCLMLGALLLEALR
jgi:hypothetical protein